jgi:hypothetical protein
MTIDERAFRLCMGALALLMLAWAVAYWHANAQTDGCMAAVQARLDGLQARIAPDSSRLRLRTVGRHSPPGSEA